MAPGMLTAEVSHVADYPSLAEQANANWEVNYVCPVNRRTPDLSKAAFVQTFGFDLKNSAN